MIRTSAAPDAVRGGSGDDVIDVREGTDLAHGDDGADRVETSNTGSYDFDTPTASDDNDRLYGDAGDDTMVALYDVVIAPNLILLASDVDDTILGPTASDEIDGGPGFDRVSGRGGDDTLRSGTEDDVLDGGAGTIGSRAATAPMR